MAIRGPDERLGWELRCLERIRRGDRRGFAEIYAEYAPSILAQVLLPRLGSPAAAEEALAETFRAALERLGDFHPQGGGGLFAWLARIAMNKAADLHRERARTGKALASFEALIAPLREGEPSADFDRNLDRATLRAAIEQVLAEVLPRYRRAIELRMLEDLPRVECAARMEIAVGNFDVVLLRALRAFRAAWIARHGMEER